MTNPPGTPTRYGLAGRDAIHQAVIGRSRPIRLLPADPVDAVGRRLRTAPGGDRVTVARDAGGLMVGGSGEKTA